MIILTIILTRLLLTVLFFVLSLLSYSAEFITIQSTTSIANSGLYDWILPKFEQKSGIKVRVVAVGSGQAIKNAKNGDGDILLIHVKPLEEKFVEEGYGIKRFDVMYNHFIIVGPAENPARISKDKTVTEALLNIAFSQSVFISRGDYSGTHKKELRLWNETKFNPKEHSGYWYRESGLGMGETLNICVAMNGYTLTDRATWINFKNKHNFMIYSHHDSRLLNQYGIILLNDKKYPHVKVDESQQFIDWLLSQEGQDAIANYKVFDQQLFFPNAQISQ